MAGYVFRCPTCRIKFRWDDPVNGLPEQCPNPKCKSRIASDRDDGDVVMPFVRNNAKVRAVDDVYRAMERGSEIRAQAAADMLGVPVSEMSALKITDGNDRQRPGDIFAKEPPPSAVSQAMSAMPNLATMGLEFSRNVGVGHEPNAGARMLTQVRAGHQAMVAKECVGIDAYTRQPVIPNTDVMSEAPSNEVLQPGYRRRG